MEERTVALERVAEATRRERLARAERLEAIRAARAARCSLAAIGASAELSAARVCQLTTVSR